MVKKLLTLNQIEFGQEQINFERFDIVELVQSVIQSATLLAQQKEAEIYMEEREPLYVWGDEYMVEEVVTNYVSNAINHVAGEKRIRVTLEIREEVVRVSVFNTGNPIPEEELDKIWIKFYKVDKARTRAYGGSGIGLSIVKAIVESMNQQCGVKNHQDGVEFWFDVDRKTKEI
jgi:signal transduction histidine kinase